MQNLLLEMHLSPSGAAEAQARTVSRAKPNGGKRATAKEGGSMKPTQTRIADRWCKLMHKNPMWPSHGQYECRTCGRRHQVCWERPAPDMRRTVLLPQPAQSAVRSIPHSIPQPGIY